MFVLYFKRYGYMALLALVLDRLSKFLAERMQDALEVIPGFFRIAVTHNTGMAFSILSGHPLLLAVIGVAMLIAGTLILHRYEPTPWIGIPAMMIFGGAVGNMIDRLCLGYVIDMIDFYGIPFAVFNVADTCLVCGCGLMMISLLIKPDQWREKHGTSD